MFREHIVSGTASASCHPWALWTRDFRGNQRPRINPTHQGCTTMQTNTSRTDTVEQLNSFLRGELSAAESYREALAKLPSAASRSTLEECARSHQERVSLLTSEVRR